MTPAFILGAAAFFGLCTLCGLLLGEWANRKDREAYWRKQGTIQRKGDRA